MSAPSVSTTFCGAITLPSDLLILRPSPSTTKPCVSKALVGRHAVQHARHQQRRMEPAAMLVRAFEIEIGRKLELSRVRAAHHGLMRRARIEPHIQRVLDLDVLLRFRAQQILRIERLPRFDAALLDALRHLLPAAPSVRGCSSPVSLWMKNGIGTPHWRWRDSVQSGRLAIMPCSRAWPQSG